MPSSLTHTGIKMSDRERYEWFINLPLEEYRAARARLSPAEREMINRIWAEESADAVASYNRYVEEHGMLLEQFRAF